MEWTALSFISDIAGWQWAIVGIAAAVVVIGVVVRQVQRKKAGL